MESVFRSESVASSETQELRLQTLKKAVLDARWGSMMQAFRDIAAKNERYAPLVAALTMRPKEFEPTTSFDTRVHHEIAKAYRNDADYVRENEDAADLSAQFDRMVMRRAKLREETQNMMQEQQQQKKEEKVERDDAQSTRSKKKAETGEKKEEGESSMLTKEEEEKEEEDKEEDETTKNLRTELQSLANNCTDCIPMINALLLPRAPHESREDYDERAMAAAELVLSSWNNEQREALIDLTERSELSEEEEKEGQDAESESAVRSCAARERRTLIEEYYSNVKKVMLEMRSLAQRTPSYRTRTETKAEFRDRLNKETDYHTFDDVAGDMPQRCFARPVYEDPFEPEEDLTFMIMDMDTTNTLTTQWDVLKRADSELRQNYWSFFVRLFGVTEDGRSVCCYVRGFAPYVYVEIPQTWNTYDCKQFLTYLDTRTSLQKFKMGVSGFEIVDRVNIYGYTKNKPIRMMKICFYSAGARRKFIEYIAGYYVYKDAVGEKTEQEREFVPGHRTAANYRGGKHDFWLWDSMIKPREQFVNDTNILPSHWVTMKQSVYELHNRPMTDFKERRSRCQIDIDVDFDAIEVHTERTDIAPFLIESWDIECVRGPRDDQFPDAENAGDEIIQIGSSVWRFGDDDFCYQSVHCVRPTANIDLSTPWDCFSYKTEKDMLDGYLRYTRDHLDPDIRLAFNQYGFDNPYWDTRNRRHFKYTGPKTAFEQGDAEYGRIMNRRSACKAHFGGSKAHGGRTTHSIAADGRVDLDVFKHASEQWKMPRGLNFIAQKELGLGKDDIDYRQINRKYDEGAYERGEVAKYCRIDTELPIQIVQHRKLIVEMLEQSRLCGVPLDEIFNKKMMVRVFALIARKASAAGFALPEHPERFVLDPHLREMMFGDASPEGATVLPPKKDFYDVPITVLDFASLYPSIMRGYRLCYTTLILDPKYLDDPDTTYKCLEIRNPQKPEEPPFKVYWATNVDKPLIYNVLTELLGARSVAKKEMFAAEEAGDEFNHSRLNAKQNALKVVCNSVYGFTGAKVGKLPNMAITAAVTHYGRWMIAQSKEYIEQNVSGSDVIYGDTDSVMVDFGLGNSDEAFRQDFILGKKMAAEISDLFPAEVKLEFEKIFYPYILWGKKNYAGILYTDPDKPGEYKKKGIASVRGDKIKFVKRLTDALVNQMIEDKSTVRAKVTLLAELQRLVDDEVSLEDLIIEKKLTKETEMYGGQSESGSSIIAKDLAPPEHVVVAQEMQKRCPGQAPGAGSMVAYVLAFDNEKQCRVPVDVAFFRANPQRFRIHTEHYLTNLIHEMIGKLIDLPRFDKDPYRLFDPYIAQARARNMGSDMSKFVRKRKRDRADFDNGAEVSKHGHFNSAMKRARLKKEDERRLKDEARAVGREYTSYKEGASIASFVKKSAIKVDNAPRKRKRLQQTGTAVASTSTVTRATVTGTTTKRSKKPKLTTAHEQSTENDRIQEEIDEHEEK